MMRPIIRGLASIAVLLAVAGPAHAFQLIKAEDASGRPGPILKPRGNVPGPTVFIEKPGGRAELTSPIAFDVKFTAFAGSAVDVKSIRIIYVKDPLIDLTQRVIEGAGPMVFQVTGFAFNDAEVVPGTHTIRIEVHDTDGRIGFANATFTVR